MTSAAPPPAQATDVAPTDARPTTGGGVRTGPSAPSAPPTLPARPARPLDVRSAGVDGLRAVAAGAVVTGHLRPDLLPGGSVGVDVFFGISGFVITTLLVTEYERTGRIGLRRFYTRRFLRLAPALMVLCGLVAVLALATPLRAFEGQWLAALLAATYVANLVRAGQPGPYGDTMGALPHTWSLAVEEQFYLAWPIVLRALLGRLRSRTVLAVVGGLCLAPTVLRLLIWEDDAAHRIYNGFDTRADQLLVGCLLALVLWHLRDDETAVARIRTWAGRLAWVAAAALGLVAWRLRITGWVDGWTPAWYTFGFLAVAVLTATVLAVLVLDRRHPLSRLLALPPLAWVGQRLSYGLYLWHYPILAYVGTLHLVPQVEVMLVVGGAFAMAGLSYRFVERPLLRRKQRYASA
ncbi:Peptidoglycan/LPS O-acetylase OafA/YrhL, contains acyltransferase and SGNH-hydrolase domains [Actinopolymorpha cephalotaxi]|uniref:Peptidoglycan/LPS O-acetylase OafA/YrhL n=1 Tax=Actinopolymorpha cephalotaxi TaxID=504797 RepID=A0A1I2UJ31_9ACTN|nr:acyltransferase [Actinopolymorpha cephalotaxi]NYH86613.1 peptidoglycan/LPS O-acetylase OafA/YrhL [Actinopolymorpha cephalotaxi]SFG77058.1 Peptidoglycan/LPS O-acetylase OafA/YrhL, contains acyltransferase and SGNH-hydrolase domains [Actinopolymorpha cephalotaxi]